MKINTNISSLTAQEASTNTNRSIASSLEKLSTGLKINKASDDASGLAIADKLRTQVTSINQGIQMVTQLLLYFKLLINLWLSNQKF
jgi:flagellin